MFTVSMRFHSYRKERARHEKLARERLAALKAKRAEKEAAIVLSTEEEQREAIEAKLHEEQEKEKVILSQEALELQKGGVVAVQEAILKEVEKKHSIEIKV
jgi:diphthamide synthase subunit DPH2